MPRTLYIHIDESGNPSDDTHYVVAAAWSLSEVQDANRVLQPTASRIKSTAEGYPGVPSGLSELKGSGPHTDALNHAVFPCLGEVEYSDNTVETQRLPWEISTPLRFSVHSVNPDMGIEILEDKMGNRRQAIRTMKTLALSGVLTPLHSTQHTKTEFFDDIRVILDSEVWKNPSERLNQLMSRLDVPDPEISFELYDSKQAPGIQIADLGAYSWRRHDRESDCKEAVDKIHKLRFSGE